MKISFHPFIRALATALILSFAAIGHAQPTPSAAEKSAPPTSPPPSAAPTQVAPDAVPTPAPETAPAAQNVPEEDRSKLRRIDDAVDQSPAPAPRRVRRGGTSEFPFGDHTISSGSRTREVVSIMGSTLVQGEVQSDAVSIAGSTVIADGAKVRGAAVAVFGRLQSDGEIGGEAVSVFGTSSINGHVAGEAVAVMGNLNLGPKAIIDGDVVVVGGRLIKDPNAVIHGNEVGLPFLGPVGDLEWLTTWVKRCAFYGRPLAFGRNLGWAWAIAFSFFAFYLLLALLFPRAVVKCVETLETRPGYSILSSVLTVLLTPVAIVLLAVTIVGALLVPFLGAGLMFATLFGKAVMLTWIGRRFTRLFSDGSRGHPVFAVLIGGVIVLLIYTVPIMGFLTYKLLSWLGLGVVVFTIALAMKREKPAIATAGPTMPPMPSGVPIPPSPVAPVGIVAAARPFYASTPVMPVHVSTSTTAGVPKVSAGFSESAGVAVEPPPAPEVGPVPEPPKMEETAAAAAPPVMPPPVVPPMPPPLEAAFQPGPAVPPAVAWPRAGLFIRLAALGLDGILIGLIMAFISGLLPRFLHFHNGPGGWLIVLALYAAVMWKHKGTTIGGIVCGLKVVRVDNRELDWATAIVRALACFLSLAVAGLGFIWVAIDDDKQSWHDKIAGTTVVHVPRGVSLL